MSPEYLNKLIVRVENSLKHETRSYEYALKFEVLDVLKKRRADLVVIRMVEPVQITQRDKGML